MMTPQLTEQYGQVERVSVARAIFSSRISAYAGFRSKPKTVAAAPPSAATFRKFLRFVSMARPSGGRCYIRVDVRDSGQVSGKWFTQNEKERTRGLLVRLCLNLRDMDPPSQLARTAATLWFSGHCTVNLFLVCYLEIHFPFILIGAGDQR